MSPYYLDGILVHDPDFFEIREDRGTRLDQSPPILRVMSRDSPKLILGVK